jgi:uncharacterized membrane protein (DUF2068 family)
MAVLSSFITVPLKADGADEVALAIVPGVLMIVSVVLLTFAVLRFVVGWSLLKLRPWGRTFAIAMSFLALIQPPFDTALGVYTLFVLLPDPAGDEYRHMCQPRLADPTAAAPSIPG